jgi:hypothetical protein
VNRDAETTEAGAGALTGPVVTDTETLQPDAPVETAGIVSPDSGNAAASLESDASEDASLAAGDAFGGQEDPAAAAVDGDPEDAVTGGEDAGKPREG